MAIKLDSTGARELLRAQRNALPMAAREAAKVLFGGVVQNIQQSSPRDTNRFANAWADAGRQAGVWAGPIATIQPSRNRERIIGLLTEQHNDAVEYLNKLRRIMAARYPSPPKFQRTGGYSRLQNDIRKQERHVERARVNLEKFIKTPEAIAMMRGSGAALNGYERNLDSRTLQLSARDKVIGGAGRLIETPEAVTVEMINREPHARVVEKRYGVLRNAQGMARAAGVQRASTKFIQTLTARAGGAKGVS